jgi:RHS repeat-associated protein
MSLRLAETFSNKTTSLPTGTTNIDYLYDASGNMSRESGNRNLEYDYRQRTRLYFITNNTTLYEQYTYGADGNVVKRLNRSSGLIYSYVYIDGLFQYSDQIGHASNAQNHINILDPSGAIISQHRQGTFSGEVAYTNGELYMINNHVGSVIGTYDLNGTQQEGEDYYPFGDSSHHWNGNKQQRFAGKIRLSWTGYYDFGARQYIPWLAKFTSVDPLAAKSTDRNPYHYASNNPINRTDPTGMSDGKGDGKGGGGKGETSNSSKSSSALSNEKTTGILFAGPNEEKAYNSFKREVLATVDTLQKTVDNLNSSLSEARSTGNEKKATSISKELETVTGRLTKFTKIKEELTQLEASDEPFRIRMGNNISNTSGGGNISFNKVTNEIDINISFEDKFNTNQKLSHELKHAFQFLQKELDLSIDGKGGRAYDLTDEERAFDRQNLFATRSDEFVDASREAYDRYKNLRDKNYPISVSNHYNEANQSEVLAGAQKNGRFNNQIVPSSVTIFKGVIPAYNSGRSK